MAFARGLARGHEFWPEVMSLAWKSQASAEGLDLRPETRNLSPNFDNFRNFPNFLPRPTDIGHQRRLPQSIPESTATPRNANVLVYNHRIK